MKPDDQAARKLLHSHVLDVRWSDQDVNGHVNNTTYFVYFEQARIAWMHGVRALNNARTGQGCVVAQASCNYFRAIPYPEQIEVRVYAGRVGRTSFTLLYDIVRADGSVKYADGQTVMVWVDRESGKSHPLPEFVKVSLGEPSSL